MLRADLRLARGGLDLDVSLELARGTLALAGPSGAGKTTILRILCGLERPDRATVAWDDEVWSDTDAGVHLAVERRPVGVVFQHYALFPHLSARENVAFGIPGEGGRAGQARRRERAERLLGRMGLDADAAGRRPGELSGGERQRVALARALARAPRLLLLDEPLAALDASTRSRASRALLDALREARVPCLLVTHDFGEAVLLADEVAVLEGGRIAQRGPAARLSAAPASAFVADFSGANVLHGEARPGEAGLTRVALDGGGELLSPDSARGRVAASVLPWEIALEPTSAGHVGSARNRLRARVTDVTRLGNRVRVGLALPQPLVAEVTAAGAAGVALSVGDPVLATFKATATRLIQT